MVVDLGSSKLRNDVVDADTFSQEIIGRSLLRPTNQSEEIREILAKVR